MRTRSSSIMLLQSVLLAVLVLLNCCSSVLPACIPLSAPSPLRVFGDFSTQDVSTQGAMPDGGSCITWPVKITYSPISACSQTNSTLLLEFWMTNGTSPIDPQRTISGVYFMAAGSQPSVSFDLSGGLQFSPNLPSPLVSASVAINSLYMDEGRTVDQKPTFRMALPTGLKFNLSPTIAAQTWYVTLANMNPVASYDALSYSIRATCMPAEKLPCPRPSPSLWECNSPWPGASGAINGQCTVPKLSKPEVKTCVCSLGFADDACDVPATQIYADGNKIQFPIVDLPGSSWRYYFVNIPYQGNANLLVEMSKPAGSANIFRPVLMLTPRSSSASSQIMYDIPGTSTLDPSSSVLLGNCMCGTCNCYIPYQASDLVYETAQMSGAADSYSWWIGVYNSLPYAGSTASNTPTPTTNNDKFDDNQGISRGRGRHVLQQQMTVVPSPVQLKVSWTVSSVGQAAGPLCPLECSGNGVCVNPPQYSVKPANQPVYQCACRAGWGGEYCQGQLKTVPLAGASSFDTGLVSLGAGNSKYYFVSIDTNSLTSGSNTLSISWTVGQPVSSNLYFIFSPVYSNSLGNLYFMPAASWVLNSTTRVPIPNIGSLSSGYLSTWILGVFNSDAQASTASTYQLLLDLPRPLNASILSTLQMGLIGAVSSLIVVLIIFMAIKILLMRRQSRHGLVSPDGEEGMQMGPRAQRRGTTLGVPPDIIESFPVFKFHEATFEPRKDQEGDAEAEAEAAAAGVVGVTSRRLSTAGVVSARRSGQGSGRFRSGQLSGLGSVPAADAVAAACGCAVAADGDDLAGRGGCEEKEAPQCSVCIMDFEEEELLRRLPCMHVFHQSCIDQWMTQHNTCPNCRRPLCPDIVAVVAEIGQRRATRSAAPLMTRTPEEGQEGNAVSDSQAAEQPRLSRAAEQPPLALQLAAVVASEQGSGGTGGGARNEEVRAHHLTGSTLLVVPPAWAGPAALDREPGDPRASAGSSVALARRLMGPGGPQLVAVGSGGLSSDSSRAPSTPFSRERLERVYEVRP